jgi:hypothetical protein
MGTNATVVTSFCKIAKLPGLTQEIAFPGNEIPLTEALKILADELKRPELKTTAGFEIRINNVLVNDPKKAVVTDRDTVTLVGKVNNG